ncbi:MAG: ATP-binding protein [Pseudomonadota bacterium]
MVAVVLLAAVLAAVLSVVTSTLWISRQHNDLAAEKLQIMVQGAAATLEENIRTTTTDYAYWTEAFNAIRAGDIDWVYGNIGTGAAETGTTDLMIIVEPGGTRNYGWGYGMNADPARDLLPKAILERGLSLLDGVSTTSTEARSGFVYHGERLVLLGVARVLPFKAERAYPDVEIPRLIFANYVDTSTLQGISDAFLLTDLKLVDGLPDPAASVELQTLFGEPAFLSWDLPSPGDRIIERFALSLGIVIAVMALIGIVTSVHVILSARRLERALGLANAADKAKTEFLANISHELRTPMNGVIGVAQILRTTNLSPEQVELLNVMHTSANAQMDIIADLLDYSRIEAGRLRLNTVCFDPGQVIRQVGALILPEARKKGIDLRVQVPETSGDVLGDPQRYQQVVSNLVGNAVKFTESGHVEIRLRHDTSGKRARVVLEVEDTGPGIDPVEHSRIFERFTQVDGTMTRAASGVGLGLAITHSLVELMGGSVWVHSAMGAGAKFVVDIAFDTPEVAGGRPAPLAPEREEAGVHRLAMMAWLLGDTKCPEPIQRS